MPDLYVVSGLFYSLKPTKFGFQLCAEGFSEKMGLLISSIVEAVYKCDFTADLIKTVLEVHRKALQSCAAEPLRNQSKYLLNALLSARVWTREQRLAAMENISQQEVVSFGRNFLDSHSVESLFYGNISKQQVWSGGLAVQVEVRCQISSWALYLIKTINIAFHNISLSTRLLPR